MGSLGRGYTFGATEEVTAAKIHALVDDGTVSGIVDADVNASAGIQESKLNLDGSQCVLKSDTQAITGDKTFSGDNSHSGTNTFSGAVDFSNNIPTIPTTPTQDDHAASKKYIDDLIIDEDDMSSNSDSHVPTQQSAKAYIDAGKGYYSGQLVYDGNFSNSWTDLDLSSFVGANRALVYLRVKGDGGVSAELEFRTNGDAGDIGYSSSYALGASGGSFPAGGQCYCVVATDASGIIERKALNSSAVTVYLIGYLLLS